MIIIHHPLANSACRRTSLLLRGACLSASSKKETARNMQVRGSDFEIFQSSREQAGRIKKDEQALDRKTASSR